MRNSSSNDGNGRNGDNRSSGQSGCISSGMGDRGDSSLHEHKLRKVKLKVGGVTHTIHAKSTSESATGGHYVKSSHSSDVSRQCQKPVLQVLSFFFNFLYDYSILLNYENILSSPVNSDEKSYAFKAGQVGYFPTLIPCATLNVRSEM